MPQEISVSFVVIAYNEAANVARTLAAITALEGLDEYEIIVVDDGSHDNTVQTVVDIAAPNPRIRLIELKQNRGRGYARSQGVAAARGRLIAMVDADIVLPTDWLTRASGALGDRDAVGGIAVPDGDVAYVYRRFNLTPRVVPGTTMVTGNNGLYRRRVFDIVGFDPALREGEDVALNHAMNQRGLSSAAVSGLLVEHRENKSLVISLKWLFDSGRGATRQLVTFHEIRQPDLASGAFICAVVLGISLVMRQRRIIGTAIPVGFVIAASIQHVRSRFETPRSLWFRVVPAVAVDSTMLAAYFTGRLVGLTVLWRRPNRARGRHVPRSERVLTA